MKLEKYKWKVKEIRLLQIVIRLDSIKMEIKVVLNWPVLRKVKNI